MNELSWAPRDKIALNLIMKSSELLFFLAFFRNLTNQLSSSTFPWQLLTRHSVDKLPKRHSPVSHCKSPGTRHLWNYATESSPTTTCIVDESSFQDEAYLNKRLRWKSQSEAGIPIRMDLFLGLTVWLCLGACMKSAWGRVLAIYAAEGVQSSALQLMRIVSKSG